MRWTRLAGLVGAAAVAGVGRYAWAHRRAEQRAIRSRPIGAAVVVFGASVDDTGPSGELRSRLDHALSLWRSGAAPVIVVSGGVDRGIDEVDTMRAYLADRGVPESALIEGRPGSNTRQTVSTMATLDLAPYVAVSSGYHSYRILAEARRRGVAAVASAPPVTPETGRLRSHAVRFVTDMVGSAWYALPTRLTSSIDVSLVRHRVPQVLAGTRVTPRGDMVPDASPSLHVAPGHPYSPIPSPEDVERAESTIANAVASLPGIDLRGPQQGALLESWVHAYTELDLPIEPGAARFHLDNTWFTYADAIAYALMLRHLRPARVIEVGIGFSSALALDIDERFLDGATRFTFIDPDPQRAIEVVGESDLAGRLMAVPVQDVDPAVFRELGAGDVLFVDSSHVLKAGSDVQYLFNEVLPVLAPGVHVHFHDVFYPFEYPSEWLRRGVSFTEAYAVRALLQGGERFRIVLFTSYLQRFRRDWLSEHMPLMLAGDFPTGGIWLERVDLTPG